MGSVEDLISWGVWRTWSVGECGGSGKLVYCVGWFFAVVVFVSIVHRRLWSTLPVGVGDERAVNERILFPFYSSRDK